MEEKLHPSPERTAEVGGPVSFANAWAPWTKGTVQESALSLEGK